MCRHSSCYTYYNIIHSSYSVSNFIHVMSYIEFTHVIHLSLFTQATVFSSLMPHITLFTRASVSTVKFTRHVIHITLFTLATILVKFNDVKLVTALQFTYNIHLTSFTLATVFANSLVMLYI